jgi:hypothetical protein
MYHDIHTSTKKNIFCRRHDVNYILKFYLLLVQFFYTVRYFTILFNSHTRNIKKKKMCYQTEQKRSIYHLHPIPQLNPSTSQLNPFHTCTPYPLWYDIWGSHTGGVEHSVLLGCYLCWMVNSYQHFIGLLHPEDEGTIIEISVSIYI